MQDPIARIRSIALATAITLAIVAVEVAFPSINFASAEIVPLLLLVRVVGLRLTVVLAVVSAPLLVGLDALLRRDMSVQELLLEAGLLVAIFVVVVALVEHYRRVLVRANVTDAEDFARGRTASRDRDLASIAETIPQLVWASRSDGTAEYFNSAWFAYTGLSRGALASGGIEGAAHPDDVDLVREAWRASGSGRVFDIEFRLRARDGSYGWFLGRATPLFGDDGATIVRWFGTCTDIDARKRAEAALGVRFAEAGRISEAFVRASLPTTFPDVPGLRFDAVYRAGDTDEHAGGNAGIGGCWYDAIRLVDGRVVLSVGEVTGGGLTAATVMVAMRQAIRGAAAVRAEPLSILEAADRTRADESPERRVTAFVGVFDPVSERLAYASAGHAPPLLRDAAGFVRTLAAAGRPFGIRRKGDSEAASIAVAPGSMLLLYTSALLSHAGDAAGAESRLRAAVADAEPDVATSPAAAIAAATLGADPAGDLALLAVTFDGDAGARIKRWTFSTSDLNATRIVRDEVAAAVAAGGADDALVGDLETIFAELLRNVVRHAPGACDVALDLTGVRPVLSMLDRGTPRIEAPGRGLFIVRSLAVDFDAAPRPGGGTHARAVLRPSFPRTAWKAPLPFEPSRSS